MYQQLIQPQINSREVCGLTGICHRQFLATLASLENSGEVEPARRRENSRTVGTETVAVFIGEAAFMDAARIAQMQRAGVGRMVAREFFWRLARLTEWQQSIGQLMGADVTQEAQ